MLLMILAWIVAILRPSYVILFAFGAAAIAFSLPLFFATRSHEERLAWLVSNAIGLAILYGVGVPIVALCLWMRSRQSSAERDADRELERMRAEAAAREGQQGGGS